MRSVLYPRPTLLRNRPGVMASPEGDPSGGDGGAGGGGSGDPGHGSGNEGSGDEEVAKLRAELKARDERISKMHADLGKANSEAAERRKMLEHYSKIGKPEDVDRILAERAEREQKEREARGAYEEQLQEERANTANERKRVEELTREYHSTMIERDILAGAAAEQARKQSMSPLFEGGVAQIVAVTRDMFEYDPETKLTLHKVKLNESGPRAGKRMTPQEFFAAEKKGSLALYFQAALLPGGGGEGGESASDTSGVVVIKRSDPDRVTKFQAADKANKRVRWED